MIKIIFINIVLAFLGFAVGRIGHIFGGQLKSPHHWIYGFILIFVGLFFHKKAWGFWSFSFGLGLFVSDFKDFLDFKIYGIDDPQQIKKFWQID